MKALVDHGGIVQFKYILRNMDDVMSYHDIASNQHGRHMLDNSDKPNRIRDVMSELSKIHGDSMFITAAKMVNSKITAMMKQIKQGKVIVINMAGGWCFWDDTDMKEITMDDFMDTVVDLAHGNTQGTQLSHKSRYVYPDIPKNPTIGDIIKLYRTQADRLEDKNVIYLESIEDGWRHICIECKTYNDCLAHMKQIARKKQMFKLVGTKIPQPVN